MECAACEHFPETCQGCEAEQGRPFWCEHYNNGEVCKRYVCCTQEKGLAHCGQCDQLPCRLYNVFDKRKAKAENERKFRKQLENLWLADEA